MSITPQDYFDLVYKGFLQFQGDPNIHAPLPPHDPAALKIYKRARLLAAEIVIQNGAGDVSFAHFYGGIGSNYKGANRRLEGATWGMDDGYAYLDKDHNRTLNDNYIVPNDKQKAAEYVRALAYAKTLDAVHRKFAMEPPHRVSTEETKVDVESTRSALTAKFGARRVENGGIAHDYKDGITQRFNEAYGNFGALPDLPAGFVVPGKWPKPAAETFPDTDFSDFSSYPKQAVFRAYNEIVGLDGFPAILKGKVSPNGVVVDYNSTKFFDALSAVLREPVQRRFEAHPEKRQEIYANLYRLSQSSKGNATNGLEYVEAIKILARAEAIEKIQNQNPPVTRIEAFKDLAQFDKAGETAWQNAKKWAAEKPAAPAPQHTLPPETPSNAQRGKTMTPQEYFTLVHDQFVQFQNDPTALAPRAPENSDALKIFNRAKRLAAEDIIARANNTRFAAGSYRKFADFYGSSYNDGVASGGVDTYSNYPWLDSNKGGTLEHHSYTAWLGLGGDSFTVAKGKVDDYVEAVAYAGAVDQVYQILSSGQRATDLSLHLQGTKDSLRHKAKAAGQSLEKGTYEHDYDDGVTSRLSDAHGDFKHLPALPAGFVPPSAAAAKSVPAAADLTFTVNSDPITIALSEFKGLNGLPGKPHDGMAEFTTAQLTKAVDDVLNPQRRQDFADSQKRKAVYAELYHLYTTVKNATAGSEYLAAIQVLSRAETIEALQLHQPQPILQWAKLKDYDALVKDAKYRVSTIVKAAGQPPAPVKPEPPQPTQPQTTAPYTTFDAGKDAVEIALGELTGSDGHSKRVLTGKVGGVQGAVDISGPQFAKDLGDTVHRVSADFLKHPEKRKAIYAFLADQYLDAGNKKDDYSATKYYYAISALARAETVEAYRKQHTSAKGIPGFNDLKTFDEDKAQLTTHLDAQTWWQKRLAREEGFVYNPTTPSTPAQAPKPAPAPTGKTMTVNVSDDDADIALKALLSGTHPVIASADGGVNLETKEFHTALQKAFDATKGDYENITHSVFHTDLYARYVAAKNTPTKGMEYQVLIRIFAEAATIEAAQDAAKAKGQKTTTITLPRDYNQLVEATAATLQAASDAYVADPAKWTSVPAAPKPTSNSQQPPIRKGNPMNGTLELSLNYISMDQAFDEAFGESMTIKGAHPRLITGTNADGVNLGTKAFRDATQKVLDDSKDRYFEESAETHKKLYADLYRKFVEADNATDPYKGYQYLEAIRIFAEADIIEKAKNRLKGNNPNATSITVAAYKNPAEFYAFTNETLQAAKKDYKAAYAATRAIDDVNTKYFKEVEASFEAMQADKTGKTKALAAPTDATQLKIYNRAMLAAAEDAVSTKVSGSWSAYQSYYGAVAEGGTIYKKDSHNRSFNLTGELDINNDGVLNATDRNDDNVTVIAGFANGDVVAYTKALATAKAVDRALQAYQKGKRVADASVTVEQKQIDETRVELEKINGKDNVAKGQFVHDYDDGVTARLSAAVGVGISLHDLVGASAPAPAKPEPAKPEQPTAGMTTLDPTIRATSNAYNEVMGFNGPRILTGKIKPNDVEVDLDGVDFRNAFAGVLTDELREKFEKHPDQRKAIYIDLYDKYQAAPSSGTTGIEYLYAIKTLARAETIEKALTKNPPKTQIPAFKDFDAFDDAGTPAYDNAEKWSKAAQAAQPKPVPVKEGMIKFDLSDDPKTGASATVNAFNEIVKGEVNDQKPGFLILTTPPYDKQEFLNAVSKLVNDNQDAFLKETREQRDTRYKELYNQMYKRLNPKPEISDVYEGYQYQVAIEVLRRAEQIEQAKTDQKTDTPSLPAFKDHADFKAKSHAVEYARALYWEKDTTPFLDGIGAAAKPAPDQDDGKDNTNDDDKTKAKPAAKPHRRPAPHPVAFETDGSYTVKAGDRLYTIAIAAKEQYKAMQDALGSDVDAKSAALSLVLLIEKKNGIKTDKTLPIGAKLTLPTADEIAAAAPILKAGILKDDNKIDYPSEMDGKNVEEILKGLASAPAKPDATTLKKQQDDAAALQKQQEDQAAALQKQQQEAAQRLQEEAKKTQANVQALKARTISDLDAATSVQDLVEGKEHFTFDVPTYNADGEEVLGVTADPRSAESRKKVKELLDHAKEVLRTELEKEDVTVDGKPGKKHHINSQTVDRGVQIAIAAVNKLDSRKTTVGEMKEGEKGALLIPTDAQIVAVVGNLKKNIAAPDSAAPLFGDAANITPGEANQSILNLPGLKDALKGVSQ